MGDDITGSEVAEAEWGRKGTTGKRAIHIVEVGRLANFDKEMKGVVQDMHAARREGLLQGAWGQWQLCRGGPSETKTVKGGDAGRGTGCAQQADRPQGNELLKLQAVQRLGRILTGGSFLEGEGSSQGSETGSGHVEVKEVGRAVQEVKGKGAMLGVMRQWQRCSDLSRIVDVACRYMGSWPRHPTVEVHGVDAIVWRKVMQPEMFDDMMWAEHERSGISEVGHNLDWCVEHYHEFEMMEGELSEDLDRMWAGLVQRKEARDGGTASPHWTGDRWASRR